MDNKKNKCVMVIGPGGTGSKMVANVLAHVLEVHEYGTWDSNGWTQSDGNLVCHRSLPYGHYISRYPNIDEWIRKYQDTHELYFVLTTRDITISGLSRSRRFGHSERKCLKDDIKARNIMKSVLKNQFSCFIWSYETFIFLQEAYLGELYKFIGETSEFVPDIKDGNQKILVKQEQS